MNLKITLVISSLVCVIDACIPTQQIDPVTTTMATTTTTLTEAPFPCTVCPKIYDPTCQGLGIPDWLTGCPRAAEAGLEYGFGLLTTILPLLPATACTTIITCPLTTSLRIKTRFFGDLPAPVIYAWCEESGPDAGKWFTGAPVLTYELASLACTPIISG
ncbi:hypothetical protein CAEBREN_00413 [Caenorhabditis brenneri]|uniref:Uncharacterized protein n=1 Tax=Caenorhabditis brenneri TaxID=135651 RepID=G0MSW7_CAEBE|nr:hypothetical protein CAEBREN_00413 [Caenorhabditis brenneri]